MTSFIFFRTTRTKKVSYKIIIDKKKNVFIYLEATDLYKFSIGKFRLYIDPQSGYEKHKLFQTLFISV